MSDTHTHRVLVPVAVLEGEGVPASVVETFASVSVVLLGYHEIPDQTAPSQARERRGEQAQAELDELRAAFADAGGDVSARLVFTHDPLKSFERVAVELDCDAVLILNPATTIERVLVAVRGDVNVDHIADLVADVLAGTTVAVTLFHVIGDERERARGEELLSSVAAVLEREGVPRDRIAKRVVVADSPTDAILEAAADHDLLVAGESRPSIRRLIFRDRAKRLARRTIDPTLVIRGEYLERRDDA